MPINTERPKMRISFPGLILLTLVAGIPQRGTAQSGNACVTNGIINAGCPDFPGSDIGERINNATAAICTSNLPCHVVIPPSESLPFSTTINFVDSMTLECTPMGESARQAAHKPPNLQYTGTGTAVNASGSRVVFQGCGLGVGNASTGVLLSGQNAQMSNTYLIGGVVGSKTVHMTGGDNIQISFVTSFESQGDIVSVDNCIDCGATNVLVYGYTSTGVESNHTSRSLVLDSATSGFHVTNFGGGNAGLHGLVAQDVVNPGHPPGQLFFKDFTTDCSYGDGMLFDASLGANPVEAHFAQSWEAGAGDTCYNPARGQLNAAGVHISGGRGIYFEGGWTRANTGCGYLIDNSHAGDIKISKQMIYSNNWGNNNVSASGVCATAYIDGLEVEGNTITNNFEGNGHQKYGIDISSGGGHNLVFSGNNLDGNVAGPTNYPLGASMTSIGNTNGNSNVQPDNILAGNVGATTANNSLASWLLPDFGAADNFLMGFTGNMKFDGTNFRCQTDGQNNGCWGWLGSNNGTGGLYAVPTQVSSGGQTIAPSVLSKFQIAAFSPNGWHFLAPLLAESAQVTGDLSAGRILANGIPISGPHGELFPSHLAITDLPLNGLVVSQGPDFVTSVDPEQPGDCLLSRGRAGKPFFASCPPGSPVTSWTLPVTGSQALSAAGSPGAASVAVFEIPAGGVKFTTITAIVLNPDLSSAHHYALSISSIDGSLLCSQTTGKSLNAIGPVDFACSEGTTYLPQGSYALEWSSDLTQDAIATASLPIHNRIPVRSKIALLLGSGTSAGQFLNAYYSKSDPANLVNGAVVGGLTPITMRSGMLGDIPVFRLHM